MIRDIFDIQSGMLLHRIVTHEDSDLDHREELIEPNNFLQAAVIFAPEGKTFLPHTHLYRARSFSDLIAQEAWVVITGSVRVTYFDLSGKKIDEATLDAGDCSITLHGGHGYEILKGPARIYEFKSGPYEGQGVDKAFL